ncbi:hypothetical protein GGR56DRAFT_640902 [Xylariaceae sp. FL0804]|nr:hypothetical protein GGR56DRAFT_640902 [Xylariaceae sp. FL0804]
MKVNIAVARGYRRRSVACCLALVLPARGEPRGGGHRAAARRGAGREVATWEVCGTDIQAGCSDPRSHSDVVVCSRVAVRVRRQGVVRVDGGWVDLPRKE